MSLCCFGLKEIGCHVGMNSRNDLLPAQRKAYYKAYCTTYFIPDHLPRLDIREAWRGDPAGDHYYGFYRG